MPALLVAVLLLLLAPAAHAGTVTIGPSPLAATGIAYGCSAECTAPSVSSLLQTGGANPTAPGRGRVTSWRVIGDPGNQGFVKLVVATRSGTSATSRAVSAAATDYAGGANATDLPIEAGDHIGVTLCRCQSQTTDVDYATVSGAGWLLFNQNGFAEAGLTRTGLDGSDRQYQFNATVVLAPALTSLDPVRGTRAPVTLTGTDLDGATAVRFGDAAADQFTVDSPTRITATPPPGVNGTDAQVTVVGPGGTSNALTYQYRAAPAANAIDPDHGPAAGGNQVVITGFALDRTTGVTFGGQPSTLFNAETPERLRVAVPPGTPGTIVQVVVTTETGSSNTLGYAYDALVVPDTRAPRVTALARAQKTILYELDEAATVTFTLKRKARGYKVKGKCRAKRKRGAKRCTRTVAAGKPFTDAGDQGTNSVALPKLGKGAYVLTAVARDAAGNAGKPRRASFTVR